MSIPSEPSDSWSSAENQHTTDPSQEAFTISPSANTEQEELVEPPSPSPESMLPPEAQGEANGGPLGCCLGIVVGLLLTFAIMLTTSVLLSSGSYLGPATLPVPLLGAAICGFLGWKIGKRFYREYEPDPRQQQRLERWEQQRKTKHPRSSA